MSCKFEYHQSNPIHFTPPHFTSLKYQLSVSTIHPTKPPNPPPQIKMVACPYIGNGPYGTSPRSAASSTSNVTGAKLDAEQIESIFQDMNKSQESVPAGSSSSRRFSWFSRQYVQSLLRGFTLF
jgi:hypothetical protein